MLFDDLSAFFSESEFAVACTAFDQHGVSQTFPVIFDAPSTVASLGFSGMAATQPVALTASANVIPDPVGWAVTIGGTPYIVAAHEPDGTGMTRLILEAA